MTRAVGCLLLLAGVCLLGAAARAQEPDAGALQISAGPAFYTLPRFPGAGRSRTLYFPFIDAEFDHRLYMSASDLVGVYAYKSEVFQTGAALVLDPTHRLAQDDAHLRGMPDVKDTARVKLFASRTWYFVTVEENFATDVLGRGQGSLSQTNLWLTAPLATGLSVNLGPGVTWADRNYMQSFYAVSDAQALRNPLLSPYAAHAGVADLHLNGLAEWQLLSHYRLGLLAYVARLHGQAADSPLALQRAQRMLMGWAAYRFR